LQSSSLKVAAKGAAASPDIPSTSTKGGS
jgi:hypothetical protein